MNNKKICVITGSSSEFGALKLLIKKIDESEKLKLQFLVTGLHLLKKFGYTINEIKKEGLKITKTVPMYQENETSSESLGKAIGLAISKLSETFTTLKPDLVVVTGDRFEMLAATIGAATLSIPIAHIHGGDSVPYGQIDEQIRHAITKFANIHFTATQKHAERIKLLGEENWRIHVVGAIAMDSIFQEKLLDKAEVCNDLGLNASEKLVICSQHPYIYESEEAGKQMKMTLEVLKKIDLQTIILYPNNDPGSHLIIEEIEKYRKYSKFKIFKRLDRKYYLSLLKNADLLIGNSSSGIIESPIFYLPVVNIGDRNRGREIAENIIEVPPNFEKVNTAVLNALSQEFKLRCKNVKNPYGNGTASDKIIAILEGLTIDEKFIRKRHFVET